jgi:uncharacterized protein
MFDEAAFRARGFDREAVGALCARLGIPGVVDAHCHFFPPKVQAAIWRWFDEAATEKTGAPWPIRYRGDEAALRAALEAAGIIRHTTLNYAHKPGMAAALNAWTAELLARDPAAIGTATFYPEPEAADYVDAVLADGRFRGFKIHLEVGRFDPRDPRLDPVWASIAEAGLPVVIHCGSAPVAGPHNRPEPTLTVLDRHPTLKAIIAHLGAYEVEEWIGVAESRENVYLDTAMVFVDFHGVRAFPERLLVRLEALGEKILFGTDFPTVPFPLEHAVESVTRLGQSDRWLRAVLHDNALKVFGVAAGNAGAQRTAP